MSTGCAVVASDVGGIPEIIQHGKSGLLVPPENDRKLAEALDSLASSPELRAQLGRGARARVESRFTLERCVHEHVNYIEEIAYDARPALKAVQPVEGAKRNVLVGDPTAFDPLPAREPEAPTPIAETLSDGPLDDELLN